MEFLDKLVLPQSAEHIELLHYMLMLVLFIFIPFISIIFGGTSLSVYFKRKGMRSKDEKYVRLAKDIIDIVTVNNYIGVILGIVPFITAILLIAQLLHSAEISTLTYLGISFVLTSIGLIMAYIYRHALGFNHMISTLPTSDKLDFQKLKKSSRNLFQKNGRNAIIFLVFGLWFFVGSLFTISFFNVWKVSGIFDFLFAPKVLVSLFYFISFSLSLSAAVVLFGMLYWKENLNLDENYKEFISKKVSSVGLIFSIPLPIFITLSIIRIPESILSGSVFVYSIIAMGLIFLGMHLLFMISSHKKYRYSALLFLVFILAIASIIIKDQKIMMNATESHAVVLSSQFDEIMKELKGDGAVAEISGKEIYDVRCASCHRFDQKLVGPAHKDVLPKYEGKEAQLVAFIKNPTKIDPAYPPMPNPGLKPLEVEAVVKYLLEEFQKNKN